MEQVEYKEMDAVEKNHFWFVAKRKFLQTVLNKHVLSRNSRVLDVGCGTGAVLEFLRDDGFVVEGVDNSEEALEYCRIKGLKVTIGTAEKMNFEDESFDVVVALDLLEHLVDDKAAVREIFRVLKKGGLLVVTVPAHQWLWSYHDVALHHKRRYSRREFETLLNSKFKIRLVTWIHSCIFLPTWFVRKVAGWLKNGNSGSDVREVNPLINKLGKFCYWPELAVFRFIRKLPWGVSLLAVVGKK